MSIFKSLTETALKMLTYQDIQINGVPVDAVFSDGYNELGLGAGMESSEPYLEMTTTLAESLSSNANVTVDGATFKTRTPIESDGHGKSIVRLVKV